MPPWSAGLAHLERLVTKEVHLLPAVRKALGSLVNVVERVCLVPAGREHVKADLTADTVRKTVVSELCLERVDKLLADLVLLVELLKVVALLDTC